MDKKKNTFYWFNQSNKSIVHKLSFHSGKTCKACTQVDMHKFISVTDIHTDIIQITKTLRGTITAS